jgi:hypothetical protein
VVTLRACACCFWLFLLIGCPVIAPAQVTDEGILFSLSGDGKGDGFTADYAHGDPEPAYLNEFTIIPDGAKGKGISAPHSEQKLMAYLSPGNIYAERGTVSFFWRARDPVGKTPFKIFFASFCDHSSLDMTWLRIDYNGHGYDAFVTDANMARVRVSYTPPVFPAPDKWTHLAFSWDETLGVRLSVDGALAARKDTSEVFSAGLGMFHPYCLYANPAMVTSECGFFRGGDIDEINIYDRMLDGEQVARLAKGEPAGTSGRFVRTLDNKTFRDEWRLRYGWNRPGDIPPYLAGTSWSVRKVEIHDAYDQKKWGWRSNDGIRETTWPDAYNRSSLPGRNDYFVEPDWYCYSTSGKRIAYTLPDEAWNYCELTGAAYGTATRLFTDSERRTDREEKLFTRPKGQERTFHRFETAFVGGNIRYENEVRETPLAEFMVYHVTPGKEPVGEYRMSYTLTGTAEPDFRCLGELTKYIENRWPEDERQVMLALPDGAPRNPKKSEITNPMPIVHILFPAEFRDEGPRTNRGGYAGFHYELVNLNLGLDGIAIDIPGLKVRPTHGEYFPLNIQVRDPLWPNRCMIDFSFSVKPGEPKTLWLDTRDRLYPDGRSLYLVIAGAGADFGPEALEGAKLRLIFKKRADAIPEHEEDRFTQVRSLFGADISEMFPQKLKLEELARFYRDIGDLFRAEPDHLPGRYYWSLMNDPEAHWPDFEQPKAPPGVPLWAFRQTEIVRQWRYFLNWWIDHRQIENGEFGGGLSDDGDFANCIPPLALLGVDAAKLTDSMHRLMDAYYANGTFTNGLNTILADALHVSEEGTNVQSELMLLEYGDPKIVERIMETAARYPDITGVNRAGHRHFLTQYYSSTFLATESPWCWSSQSSHTILHPGMTLVEFNGNPATLKLIREIGDGSLAHARKDSLGRTVIPWDINYITDEDRFFSPDAVAEVFEVLRKWTGEKKYFVQSEGASSAARASAVDTLRLADSYAEVIRSNARHMYIDTEGFPWDDGPYLSYGSILTDRLGGIPIQRSDQFPRHMVSWKFNHPDGAQNVAILVPRPTSSSLEIVVYNLSDDPVACSMVGWGVDPGVWAVTEGIDSNGDGLPDSGTAERMAPFERTGEISFSFPPRKSYVIRMELGEKGTPYWSRPELGIGKDDVKVKDGKVRAVVHNLGSVDAPPVTVSLVDASGKALSSSQVPALKAPLDLKHKTATVILPVPKGKALGGCRVVIDPERKLKEITRMNNEAAVRAGVATTGR